MSFESKYRVVLRESQNGTIRVCEDQSSNYVLLQNENVIGIYESKNDAFRAFGRLTRQ
jgi:hypothetical protein